MCGIVGYLGPREAAPIILGGLKRLEYRGYDSAGLAVMSTGSDESPRIDIRRDVGKLQNLINLYNSDPVSGHYGIGHTRWATHGAPSQRNAHPHLGQTDQVVVVHNGIVENFVALKEELLAEGATFRSDTDTEVIANLVERHLATDVPLEEAVRQTLHQMKGANVIVAMTVREPGKIVAARMGNAGGVTVGIGDGEMFIASDMPAILEHTRRIVFLEPQWMTIVTRDGFRVQTFDGQPVTPEVHSVAWDMVAAEKGEYRHFMQKEIHEQARSITDTIGGRIDFATGQVTVPDLNLTPELARKIKRIVIVACGTAAHAGMVGKVLIESLARIPVEVDIASEFRYRDPLVDGGTVVLAISQSGETADTLAAMEEGRVKGATLWSIVNVIGSQAMRVANGYITMQSGPEIGVASTKAFTAPLVDLYLLAMKLGELRGTLDAARLKMLAADLARLPDLVGRTLDRETAVEAVAQRLRDVSHCLYLGRGINMPIAYEGALKLKEISYIHAEGYPAGEMKHGPIALVDKDMPVLVIATQDHWYEKMLSQVEQAKARGGVVIAIATDGDTLMVTKADYVLYVPQCPWLLSPVLTVLPLQLLAYHIAVLRGCDVDQPRNLAKSVTVE
ncbi:MAG: glutamine--fructose-6-phosphate transaminase (isomerizing) [Chloroflexi bacterium]|nr:glutamine--fructose-6-phosphate transaminase (isomerizing) [Chloroflexota bacterium]